MEYFKGFSLDATLNSMQLHQTMCSGFVGELEWDICGNF
jgi:hypothetical protein